MEPNLIIRFIELAWYIIIVASQWKIFTKAGIPGWKSIVPLYNAYILLKLVGRPGWWLILYFIPLVNIVTYAIVALDLAKSFGKSSLFGVFGLWLFSFVGWPILGYGNSTYIGPSERKKGQKHESKWVILLIVIPIVIIPLLAILLAIVLIAVNPAKQLRKAQCTEKCSKVLNISNQRSCVDTCVNDLEQTNTFLNSK